jgi:hypothetical protein
MSMYFHRDEAAATMREAEDTSDMARRMMLVGLAQYHATMAAFESSEKLRRGLDDVNIGVLSIGDELCRLRDPSQAFEHHHVFNVRAEAPSEGRVAAGQVAHQIGRSSVAVGPRSLDLGLHRVTTSLVRPAPSVPISE